MFTFGTKLTRVFNELCLSTTTAILRLVGMAN